MEMLLKSKHLIRILYKKYQIFFAFYFNKLKKIIDNFKARANHFFIMSKRPDFQTYKDFPRTNATKSSSTDTSNSI